MSVKPMSVVKVHKRTREIAKRYASYTEAAMDNGLSITSIQRSAKEKRVSYGDYCYRFEADFDPDEDFTGRNNCPVIVKDVKTGQVAWFGCVSIASEKLGTSMRHLYKCMKKGLKVRGRFIVSYYGKRIA